MRWRGRRHPQPNRFKYRCTVTGWTGKSNCLIRVLLDQLEWFLPNSRGSCSTVSSKRLTCSSVSLRGRPGLTFRSTLLSPCWRNAATVRLTVETSQLSALATCALLSPRAILNTIWQRRKVVLSCVLRLSRSIRLRTARPTRSTILLVATSLYLAGYHFWLKCPAIVEWGGFQCNLFAVLFSSRYNISTVFTASQRWLQRASHTEFSALKRSISKRNIAKIIPEFGQVRSGEAATRHDVRQYGGTALIGSIKQAPGRALIVNPYDRVNARECAVDIGAWKCKCCQWRSQVKLLQEDVTMLAGADPHANHICTWKRIASLKEEVIGLRAFELSAKVIDNTLRHEMFRLVQHGKRKSDGQRTLIQQPCGEF